MADEHPQSVDFGIQPEKQIEAQSTFASTLLTDAEKTRPSQVTNSGKRHGNLFGSKVDTSNLQTEVDLIYTAKAQLLNEALLDIGMGRYQWLLFLVTSMTWFLDYFWMASFIIIGPSAANEAQFFYSYNRLDYLYISQFVGLTVSAAVWPTMSDHIGRKYVFTSTFVLMGMGDLVGAGMSAFTGLCVVGFVVGIAIAGNQAVDTMILLESIPASHQFLVAMQGAFWGLGQVVAYAVGWAFISGYTCGTGPDEVSTSTSFSHLMIRAGSGSGHSSSGSSGHSSSSSSSSSSCHYVSNKGWRYVWWTFGCITLFLYLCRLLFPLRETPKYLLSRRRDAEVTQTVKDIAAFNKRQTWLTESSFARVDSSHDSAAEENPKRTQPRAVTKALGVLGTSVLVLLWAVTGLTFPLQQTYISNYLSVRGVKAVTADSVSRDYLYLRYLYVSICAIPGPLISGLLIEANGLGRKRSGVLLAILTGLFMFLSTLSRSRGAALGFECIISVLYFAGLAIITTYTVEVFAGPVRGAGLGLTSGAWRLFGLIAAIITTFDRSAQTGGGVWFSGAIWILMAGAWVILPIDTRTKAAA